MQKRGAKLKSWKDRYVTEFKNAMQTIYGAADFLELNNIQDLKALLDEKGSSLPVHYPRSSETPEAKGQNFEWFMGE